MKEEAFGGIKAVVDATLGAPAWNAETKLRPLVLWGNILVRLFLLLGLSLELFREVQENLRSTPAEPCSMFDLRSVKNVIRGICAADSQILSNKQTLARQVELS